MVSVQVVNETVLLDRFVKKLCTYVLLVVIVIFGLSSCKWSMVHFMKLSVMYVNKFISILHQFFSYIRARLFGLTVANSEFHMVSHVIVYIVCQNLLTAGLVINAVSLEMLLFWTSCTYLLCRYWSTMFLLCWVTWSVLLISQNRTEWQWLKGHWILAKRIPSNFANKLWQTGKFLVKTLHVACSDVV